MNPARRILTDMAVRNAEQGIRMLKIGEGGMGLWHLREAVKQLEQAGELSLSPAEAANERLTDRLAGTNHPAGLIEIEPNASTPTKEHVTAHGRTDEGPE